MDKIIDYDLHTNWHVLNHLLEDVVQYKRPHIITSWSVLLMSSILKLIDEVTSALIRLFESGH